MLYTIKENLKRWNWRSQGIWQDDNRTAIPNLIDEVERWFYKTREVNIDLQVIDLSKDSFDCPNLFEFLTHYKLVENADLKYPVILNREGTIIDGRHRLCKAILEWKKTLKWVMILDSKII